MKTLESERLILRSWSEDDACDLYEYAKNPNVGPHAGWKPHSCIEESMAILQSFIAKGEDWALVDKGDGKVIGSFGLFPDSLRSDIVGTYTIGYAMAEDRWGRGYATEAARLVIRYAFDELGAVSVSITHDTNNLRSRRVIEKCGFTYEGTLRRSSLNYDGTVRDMAKWSMLRDEYERLYK